jgi:polysaccharide biosynthesis transport protein
MAKAWLWRKWFAPYFVYLAVVVSAAAAYWSMAPRIYEVSSIVSVKPGLYGVDAPSPRAEENVRSHVYLLESEDVIRQAVGVVGATRLYPDYQTDGYLKAEDHAYALAKKNLAVKHESLTDIIRVAFRHPDPRLAVEFAQAIVEKFAGRYSDLYTNEKAVAFYRERKEKSREEFIRASGALTAFSSANRIYSIREQQKLVLAQRSQLEAALVTTKGVFADKKAQEAEIPTLLAQMGPVGRLPQVTALTPRGGPKTDGEPKEIERLAADPPLLLVRVYQDTVALLVKLKTDLAGLQALQAKQEDELGRLADFLGTLSDKEAQFEQLRLAVDGAWRRYELFTKKAHEAQLGHDQAAARLSSVQVVQAAALPLKPISPSLALLCALVAALAFLPAGAAAAYHIAASASPVLAQQGDQWPSAHFDGSILGRPAPDQEECTKRGRERPVANGGHTLACAAGHGPAPV